VHQPSRRNEKPTASQRAIDADLILACIRATADWERATRRRSAVKPLRELIWYVWERPRLPGPLYRSTYPMSVPWTPAARAAYGQPKNRLVIEHVLPTAVLIRRLLDKPPANRAALIRVLNRCEYVVIAPSDNQRLVAAGVGADLAPDSTNPWDRYLVAGLDPATFEPIA
jgi:hypothetical protein